MLVLKSSIAKNDIITVKEILAQNTLPANNKDYLFECAKRGKLEILKLLVSAGADLHVDNDYAFSLACAHGRIQMVIHLLANHPICECALYNGFLWSCCNNHYDCMVLVFQYAPSRFSLRESYAIGPKRFEGFYRACQNSCYKIAEFLSYSATDEEKVIAEKYTYDKKIINMLHKK